MNELRGAVDSLSELSDSRLGDIRSAVDRLSDSAQEDARATQDLLGSFNEGLADVNAGIDELADVSREGFSTLTRDVNAGFGSVTSHLGALIGVTWAGFMGLSAMLAYREQNDRARHAELMALHRENSEAAKAQRALQLALTQADLGKYSEAFGQVRSAIQHYPSWAETHRVESLVRARSGDLPGALDSVETALTLLNQGRDQPSQFVSDDRDLRRLRRAVVLQAAATLAACSRLSEAITCVRGEIEQWQQHSELWHELGRLLVLSGRDREAQEPLVRAVLASPKRYGMVAVDPQLSGARSLVELVLRESRARKTSEVQSLECTWMSLHGPTGLESLPAIDGGAAYLAVSARARGLKLLLSGRAE